MRTRILGIFAALITTFLVAAPANASTDFVAQARHAGLSANQAAALQAKMDGYLAKTGGTQIAPNQIDLYGATLFVALPGEAHPRDFTGGAAIQSTRPECSPRADYGWFCAYSGTYWTGDQIGMYACNQYNIPWSTIGSWDNKQTSGTKAVFYDDLHRVYYTTPGAPTWSGYFGWEPVAKVRNC